MESFYINITSNGNSFEALNTLSEFNVELPHEISLPINKRYQVGLSKISIPDLFDTNELSHEMDRFIVPYIQFSKLIPYIKLEKDKKLIPLPKYHFPHLRSFIINNNPTEKLKNIDRKSPHIVHNDDTYDKFIYFVLSHISNLDFLTPSYFSDFLDNSIIFKNNSLKYSKLLRSSNSFRTSIQESTKESIHNAAKFTINFPLELSSLLHEGEHIEDFLIPLHSEVYKPIFTNCNITLKVNVCYRVKEILLLSIQTLIDKLSKENLDPFHEKHIYEHYIKSETNFNLTSFELLKYDFNFDTLCKRFIARFVKSCFYIKEIILAERKQNLIYHHKFYDTQLHSKIGVIYCDLVHEEILNNSKAQILSFIDLDEIREKGYIKINDINYKNLDKLNFSSISIKIFDIFGRRLNFKPSINPVMLTLHLRAIK